jgi:hypothetical protein
MKLEDRDFETLFQTTLAQFDDTPDLKRAMIRFYQSLTNLFVVLLRADARNRRGRHE